MQETAGHGRRFPVLLAAAVVVLVSVLGWMWSYGFPRPTADSMCFKQPAYMRLFTPNFSVPTYAGQCVAADKLNSYPAVIYYYLNYALFRVFGPGYFTSLALDLVLFVLLTVLAAFCIWKVTGRQLPAAVFLLASGQILDPVGRPEVLGILLVFVGLLTVERGTWGLCVAVAALGLAGVTSPGAAIVGTVLLVCYLGFRGKLDRAFWARAALLVLIPPLISAGLYAAYAWPWLSEALAQHRQLVEHRVYFQPMPWQLLRDNLFWDASTVPLLLAATAACVYCLRRRPNWFPRHEPAGALVAAAAIVIPMGCILNVVTTRATYDYRHITLQALPVMPITVAWWPPGARWAYSKKAIAALVLIFLFSLPEQQIIVRNGLAPLAWRRDAVTLAEAKRTVADVVPPEASVGGDAVVWLLIDDGRPFISVQAAAIDHWPEYLISATWARHPSVAQQPEFEAKLAAEYEEITRQPLRPVDGCSLRVLGRLVPIASGRCDWYVRIWKRRDAGRRPEIARR